MNNRRTKSILKILASQLSVALFIILLALSILFYAGGYRINLKNFKVSRIGVLYISSFPKNSTVTVNGKMKAKKTPFSLNLLPDYYSVDISHTGYVPWSKTVKIEAELVQDYKNVVLFKEKPEEFTLTDQKIINSLNSPIDTLAIKSNNGLYHSDYEIWAAGKLVTRFSEPISKAIWYPDKQHIVYQQGKEIRVIETTGTNDTLLVNLSDSVQTNFLLSDKGDQLYYIDGGQYKMAVIR